MYKRLLKTLLTRRGGREWDIFSGSIALLASHGLGRVGPYNTRRSRNLDQRLVRVIY